MQGIGGVGGDVAVDVIGECAAAVAGIGVRQGGSRAGVVVAGELILGPFQGPVACTRIARGRGVCGTAWERAETVVVPDVEEFPGHIACSGESRSKIVVPLLRGGAVTAVLDIDSRELAAFDGTDQSWLERFAALA